ncbi:MAG: hypothetical protein K2W92_08320 [Alphaproteobacteria bacterium]|nr:hypothetical protein [Alphaproteobacteria bacterium]
MSKILFRLSTLVFLFLGALSILNPSFSKGSVIHNEATNSSDVFSTADLDSFRRQLLSNWNVPVGSKEFQGYVDIKVEMNSDTSVDSVAIVSTSKPMRILL